ncbi:hypothetical protein RclHR1_10870002 [Rhizophagus clarus]|nr:hypothetical protein RclHR1_10870002 [Rhizophagus clarus]
MFLNNFLINIIIFGILFQLLVEVKPQDSNIKPDLRNAHTATLIDNKLYILGGIGSDNIPPYPTFFYLDVSDSSDTNGLEWHDLTNIISIPPNMYVAAIKGGANNKTLFLYGGEALNDQSLSNLVFTYDTQYNTRMTPIITGTPPIGKISITPVIDYNGLIYLFGGYSTDSIYTNDMFILDSINLSWKNASSINAPIPRASYGAVFLPNKNIIYIGGYNENVGVFSLNEVYIYNTLNSTWTTQTTYGSIPSARYSISSVLSLDNQKIIVYGGYGPNFSQSINPEDSLYVLNTSNFNWYIPKVVGNMPPTRAFHRSLLIENYMVITFGQGYAQETDKDILLLDISNDNEYIWKTSFNNNNSTPTITSTPQVTLPISLDPLGSEKENIIVGAIIGSALGIAITLGSFFIYKRKKHIKKQDKKPSTQNINNVQPQEILHISSEKDNPHNDREILLIPGNTIQQNDERNEALNEVIVSINK